MCVLEVVHSLRLSLGVVGFEGDLQHAVAQRESVEVLYGHERLLIIGHGDEAKALALARGVVADHLDALHGAEGTKQLPQHRVLRVGGQVVHEDAPASAVEGRGGGLTGGVGRCGCCGQCRGQQCVGQDSRLQGRVPVFDRHATTEHRISSPPASKL